jgi:hypothetical protein
MAGAWTLFKQVTQKKWSDLWKDKPENKPRIDRGLPLELRFGSTIEISPLAFILAEEELHIKQPKGNLAVISYGTFDVMSAKVHRFYLDDAGVGIYCLQIATNAKSEIEDCKLFLLFDEITVSDWDYWLNEKTGYIGYSEFDLSGITFYRVWQDEASEVVLESNEEFKITRIPPVSFTEKILTDPFGETFTYTEYDAMLYGRAATDDVDEYLFLAAVKDDSGASVQLMTGLMIEPAAVKVLF